MDVKKLDESKSSIDEELVPPKKRSQRSGHTRSRSYTSSHDSLSCRSRSSKRNDVDMITSDKDESMLLMSSGCYGESASEGAGEINDSRFNDISCISYGDVTLLDRTTEEKDTTMSRIDVSKMSMSGETSIAQTNKTTSAINTTSTDSSRLTSLTSGNKKTSKLCSNLTLSSLKSSTNSRSNRSNNRRNSSNNSSSNRNHKNCLHTSLDRSSNSAKRLRRDSARAATDGIERTNPLPLAIPILGQRDLPPDRPKSGANTSTSHSGNDSLTNLNESTTKGSDGDKSLHNTTTTTTTSDLRLASLLRLGHNCAKLLNAICVSTQLSKSYNEESLRFTCQNGHNFFLSVRKVEKTLETLSSCGNSSLKDQTLMQSITWCNKCSKYFSRVKDLGKRLHLNVLSGLFDKQIELEC